MSKPSPRNFDGRPVFISADQRGSAVQSSGNFLAASRKFRAGIDKRKLASFRNRSDSARRNMTAAAQTRDEAQVGIFKTLEHTPRLFIVDERPRGSRQLSRSAAVERGSAPASGATGDALVVGFCGRRDEPESASAARSVRREGAPNNRRGGGAPHRSHRWTNRRTK